MQILMVTPEAAPFAKTGGLADVAGSLPKSLRRLGHDVRLLLPYYQGLAAGGFAPRREGVEVVVPIDGAPCIGHLHQGRLGEVPVYFIENERFFGRSGLYGTDEGDYHDNAQRFGFFCRAAISLLPKLSFRPEVIHLNDWQTGLIPVLLRTELAGDPFFAPVATLLTIHNLGYQGLFPPHVLDGLGLDPGLFAVEALEFFDQVSFLKGGIIFADRINTVSPAYAQEILSPLFGHGFDGILRSRRNALSGILNGLDPELWDPAADPALPRPFSSSDLRGKRACKKALQKELGLSPDADTPLVAMVSRLDVQKGVDLLEDAWEGLLQRNLQLVLLGTGERRIMERLARQQDRAAGKVSINLFFDEPLSRRIYAGADLFLMPSRYEPCGLSQLIALRYGTLPLVRRTGGLADTIVDLTEAPRQGYGFVFTKASPAALLAALDRALDAFRSRRPWREARRRAMALDFSWDRSAQAYVELYRIAKEQRGV